MSDAHTPVIAPLMEIVAAQADPEYELEDLPWFHRAFLHVPDAFFDDPLP